MSLAQFSAPLPPPYPGSGPDGVLRTHLIAGHATAERLCRGVLSPRWIVRQMSVNVGLGVIVVVFVGLTGHDLVLALASAVFLVAVILIVTALLIGVVMLRTRRRMRRLIPAGTPMAAEFTPLWIGHQTGASFAQIPLDRFNRVVVNDYAVMLCQGRRPLVLLPRELVPPQVVDDYQSRYRRR